MSCTPLGMILRASLPQYNTLNYEGYELYATFRSWSLADTLTLESSSIITHQIWIKLINGSIFQKVLYHTCSAQGPFDKDKRSTESISNVSCVAQI
eukprot:scaffold1378_cov149-Skeletonema_dohrnii-CCMP3373.AAC.3